MRTYEDTFSGEKIYPGKVRCSRSLRVSPSHPRHVRSDQEAELRP